ncbi:MAG: L-threonylcarbamoyladenylate synthase [Acidobacteriota bacterium]|nr:L-threonylcarbamoyladenylate synthase [Acidobacteriota bacterium]
MDRFLDFSADEIGVAAAAGWLRSGGLLIYPTETFYALGCDPRRADAVAALRRLKGRSEAKALPLLAGSLEQVGQAAPGWRRWPRARRWAESFWPGPLSLVLDGSVLLAAGVRAADGSVALRWTSNGIAAALALELGYPVVATSANAAGAPACDRPARALEALGSGPLAVLDGGVSPGGAPSTLVDPRRDPPRLIRSGALDPSRLGLAAGDAHSFPG